MIARSTGSGGKAGQEQRGWRDRLRSDFDHNEDAPDLDTGREPGGLPQQSQDRLDRLFPKDDPSISVEDDTSFEDDASTSVGPSIARRIFRASAVFSFVVLTGVGGALAWRSYGDYATDVIRALPASTSKPAAPPADVAQIREQLQSIATDLAAVRHALEQLGANQDQLTRKQEEMEGKQGQMTQAIATLQAAEQDIRQKISFPPQANKPVHVAPPKRVQHPAQPPTQDSSKPIQVSPPQSLLPPNQ
jgi:hypothetical protein